VVVTNAYQASLSSLILLGGSLRGV
jgi:hypothetical protein